MDVITATAARRKSMATFTIDSDNNITGYAPGETVPDGNTERFTTEGELAALAAQWSAARLVEVWNSIPGLAPVRKFTSRKTAVARIWNAAQSLVSSPSAPDAAKKAAKSRTTNAEEGDAAINAGAIATEPIDGGSSDGDATAADSGTGKGCPAGCACGAAGEHSRRGPRGRPEMGAGDR